MSFDFGMRTRNLGMAISVDPTPIVQGAQLPAYSYEVFGGSGMPQMCPMSRGIGQYYNVGVPGGAQFVRNQQGGGPFAWSRAAEFCGAVGGETSGIRNGPGGVRGYMDYQLARMSALKAERRASQPEKKGEGIKEAGSLRDRAGTYFDKMVRPEDEPERNIYSSDAQRSISEAEKKDGPEAKGRESALKSLVSGMRDWVHGDNSEQKRSEFKAQVDDWKKAGKLNSDKKLLALIAPGVESAEKIPEETLQKMLSQLGPNRQPSEKTSKLIFEKYQELLEARFGDDYEPIINDLFSKTESLVGELPKSEIASVGDKDIEVKGYTGKDKEKIKEILAKYSPLKARRLFEALESPKDDDEKMQRLGAWYIKDVKGITDKNRIDATYKAGMTEEKEEPKVITFAKAIDSARGKDIFADKEIGEVNASQSDTFDSKKHKFKYKFSEDGTSATVSEYKDGKWLPMKTKKGATVDDFATFVNKVDAKLKG